MKVRDGSRLRMIVIAIAVGTVGIGLVGRCPWRAAAQPAPRDRPTLWVLAIGVSRYAEPGLALRFAELDARSIANVLLEQQKGPLYREVKSKILVDRDVTRGSILQTLEGFLGQAAPGDLAVIYMAGHGVHHAATDSYYFLPADASAANLFVEGLEMVEFSRQVERLHRNIGSLVVMLDTCYAGAAASGTRDLRFGGDLASRLVPAEGLSILTAAKAGEQSREADSLGHGAFTKALLDGLNGAAADADGFITVLGLAQYTARVVSRLTEGKQHPYYRIIGGNQVLTYLGGVPSVPATPTSPMFQVMASAAKQKRVAVMTFKDLRRDPENEWMEDGLREEFTTILNVVTQLDVYAEPEVRIMAPSAVSTMQAARQAGMDMVVTGTFAVQRERISITAHVVDVDSLRHIASTKKEGLLDDFFELRSRIVLDLLENLRVELPPAEVASILKPGSSNLEARKLLSEAEHISKETNPSPTPANKISPLGSLAGRILATLEFVGKSYAAENDDRTVELRAALEGYRAAFERKDVDELKRYYAEFSEPQRAALSRYLRIADDLQIKFTDLRITVSDSGDKAAVSFTREDQFVDHDTGEAQQVLVRLTKLFVKSSEGWQIIPEE